MIENIVFFPINAKIYISAAISIGVVTAIAAPASSKVDFEGNGGHAGAVLMPKRYIIFSKFEHQIAGN